MSRNVQELTVSELSRALKRTVENSYSYVRVRGEVSGFKRAASGHLYMTLKDADTVLDAVCWRGTAGKLSIAPEDGIEIVATGRLTTYPGRSKYQIVIEQVELAGEGALLKLLEERRKKLAEEGLFAEERKRPLPDLPEVIGVVTSPTGAVIRDILHRLAERFPRHVLFWPVLVQGEGAAEQVADAIAGFNALPLDGNVPRPDLLIVARGGGSLEDLWTFNEEVVVRATAASTIPLISAVGHETDTTLIDFASDRRAPTPTAAAEIAVPVRREQLADLTGMEQRLIQAGNRMITDRGRFLVGLVRGLPRPQLLMDERRQRLDDIAIRQDRVVRQSLGNRRERVQARADRLRSPTEVIRQSGRQLEDQSRRVSVAGSRIVDQQRERIARFARSLEAMSYKSTLERGYAVVRNTAGALVKSATAVAPGTTLEIEFAHDGRVGVQALDGAPGKAPVRKRAPAKKTSAKSDNGQRDLF